MPTLQYFFMSSTLGLFLITACAPVQADYYGSRSLAPVHVHRYVQSGQYHRHVSLHPSEIYHARPGRQMHGHSESAASRAVVISPGNRSAANIHGHAGTNQQVHSARKVIIQPLERRSLAQNNTHGH